MPSESEMKSVFTFTWKIENYFSFPAQNGEEIISPTFVADNVCKRKWFLKLYPDGFSKLNKGHISCRLCRVSDYQGVGILEVCCNIEIIDAFGEVLVRSPMQNQLLRRGRNIFYEELMENCRFLENNKYSPEDSLTIRCNMVSSTTTTKIPDCSALTKIGVDRCSFKLRANIFESSDFVTSKEFFFSNEFPFEIRVFVRAYDLKIYIYQAFRKSLPSCFLVCKIALLDLDGIERISSSGSHLFKNDVWEFDSFLTKSMLKDEASKYLRNDSFTLFCDFSFPNGVTSTEVKYIHDKHPVPVDPALNVNPARAANSVISMNSVRVLLDDFHNLYTSHGNSDVKLRADNETFPAHKLILAARSPVFRARFSQDKLENQIVDISDTDAKSLNYLLQFIYTATMDKISYERGLRLLVAADKYKVDSLKEECSIFLTSILSVENVCKIVVVADLLGHEDLKSSAVDYIRAHASKIFPTVQWKQCLKENVVLATEILWKLSVDFEKDN